MIVGGYTLDLYCDSGIDQPYGTKGHTGAPGDGGTYPGTFYAQTDGECRRQARKAGWKFRRDRTVICPTCLADPRYRGTAHAHRRGIIVKGTDKYNIYKADCGILHLVCAWEKGGYVVTVNNRTLKDSYANIADAQVAAIDYGRRLLTEASAALSVSEVSDG